VDDSLTVREARQIAEGARRAILRGSSDILLADIHLDLLHESPSSMLRQGGQWEGQQLRLGQQLQREQQLLDSQRQAGAAGASQFDPAARMLTGPLRTQPQPLDARGGGDGGGDSANGAGRTDGEGASTPP
jgi:hypothetical protein